MPPRGEEFLPAEMSPELYKVFKHIDQTGKRRQITEYTVARVQLRAKGYFEDGLNYPIHVRTDDDTSLIEKDILPIYKECADMEQGEPRECTKAMYGFADRVTRTLQVAERKRVQQLRIPTDISEELIRAAGASLGGVKTEILEAIKYVTSGAGLTKTPKIHLIQAGKNSNCIFADFTGTD